MCLNVYICIFWRACNSNHDFPRIKLLPSWVITITYLGHLILCSLHVWGNNPSFLKVLTCRYCWTKVSVSLLSDYRKGIRHLLWCEGFIEEYLSHHNCTGSGKREKKRYKAWECWSQFLNTLKGSLGGGGEKDRKEKIKLSRSTRWIKEFCKLYQNTRASEISKRQLLLLKFRNGER